MNISCLRISCPSCCLGPSVRFPFSGFRCRRLVSVYFFPLKSVSLPCHTPQRASFSSSFSKRHLRDGKVCWFIAHRWRSHRAHLFLRAHREAPGEGDSPTSVTAMAAQAMSRRKTLVSIYMAMTRDQGGGTTEKLSRMITAL